MIIVAFPWQFFAQAKVPAKGGTNVDRLLVWLRRGRLVRQNVRRLSALDDRLLADIGIARHELRHVARLGRQPGWE